MAQLRGGDEPVAVLVEVAQALDEVVGGVAAARLRDRLPHNAPIKSVRYLFEPTCITKHYMQTLNLMFSRSSVPIIQFYIFHIHTYKHLSNQLSH